jgi:hypothetical protein
VSEPLDHRGDRTGRDPLARCPFGSFRQPLRHGFEALKSHREPFSCANYFMVAFGGWISTTARVAPPVNGAAGIDPMQMMASSPKLPTEHFVGAHQTNPHFNVGPKYLVL